MIFWASHPSSFPFPPSLMLSIAASVKARYRAPESRCAHPPPRARATAAAVVDLPEAAGPSIAMTRTTRRNPFQVREEPGVANRHRAPLREPHSRAREGAEHRERHGEPVITRRVHPAPRRAIRAADAQVVPPGLGLDPHGPQVRRDEFQPVALLHPQLSDLLKDRLPAASGAARHHRALPGFSPPPRA